MAKIEKHPSGHTILFDDNWHTYKCLQEPSKRFVSGTKFLGRFFGAFDRDGISKKYAEKNNLQQADVLAMWERKGEVARESGTLVHNYLESLLLGKKIDHATACAHSDPDISAMAESKMNSADQALARILEEYDFLKAELIVASLQHNVAGMIDLLLKNKRTNRLCFADWKTNEKIELSNRWQSGIGPLAHLEDCSYIKYSTQLNIYQYIADTEGYLDPAFMAETVRDVGQCDMTEIDRIIIHIRPDDYEILPCPDLQKEVGAMMKAA